RTCDGSLGPSVGKWCLHAQTYSLSPRRDLWRRANFGAPGRMRACTQRAEMLIDFQGYSADCLISGRLELTAPRLTDMLNDEPTIQLTDVVLEGLSDARRVTVANYNLHRDEIYAVKVTGPRGSKALRIVTVPHRVQAQIG